MSSTTLSPHHRRGRGLTSRVLGAAISLAVPALTLTVAPTVAAAEDLQAAECKVHAVLASKQAAPERIPATLSFLKSELSADQFAAYKSFRLLKSVDYRLKRDRQISHEAAKHQIGLRLRGGELKRPKLHIEVTRPDRDKPLVSADYSVKPDGFLLLAGFRHPEGRLVFAIQCHGK